MHYGIVWCRRRISPRFPRFKFTHANVYNKRYNSRGRLAASAYMFPYGNGEFDYAILTSVLTHMLPDDVRHYLREIRRVLKPDGICFATMFLRNAEASELMERGKAHVTFRHELAPGCWVESADVPEGAVLYEDTMALDMFSKAGLQPSPPLARRLVWEGEGHDQLPGHHCRGPLRRRCRVGERTRGDDALRGAASAAVGLAAPRAAASS